MQLPRKEVSITDINNEFGVNTENAQGAIVREPAIATAAPHVQKRGEAEAGGGIHEAKRVNRKQAYKPCI